MRRQYLIVSVYWQANLISRAIISLASAMDWGLWPKLIFGVCAEMLFSIIQVWVFIFCLFYQRITCQEKSVLARAHKMHGAGQKRITALGTRLLRLYTNTERNSYSKVITSASLGRYRKFVARIQPCFSIPITHQHLLKRHYVTKENKWKIQEENKGREAAQPPQNLPMFWKSKVNSFSGSFLIVISIHSMI